MTTRNILLLDLGIAISAALIVLAITPGPAAAGLIAIIVLVAGVISFRRESRRQRRARAGSRGTVGRDGRAGARSRRPGNRI